ncbi:MAG: iron-containing alcohol dehydrogenase [Boseongicola sp. SB0677_bin_26]|nr:iron-containing alcohol dehydrogenase [Boseongicola sp. SB0665_bin_10]MYG25654.1 iron-containing alcohol dehydrogenase [Boseongicola sp. SB0677_bin_26]
MDLKTAFSKSKSSARSGIRGNIILQATEFGEKGVKGKVLTGPGAGTEITVSYGGRLDHKDYTKKNGKSFVDVENGGTLRIERLKPGKDPDAPYSCRWMKTFNGAPTKAQRLETDALCSYERRGEDDQKRPRVFINVLQLDKEEHVTSLDDLQAAMVRAFEERHNILIFGQKSNGEPLDLSTHITGKLVDGAWAPMDPQERVKEIMDAVEQGENGTADLEDILSNTGMSVVPADSFRVGSETAENAETALREARESGTNAMIATVDPRSWNVAGMGARLAAAVGGARGRGDMSQEKEDALTSRFMEFADSSGLAKDQVDAFTSRGWAGLADDTVKRFMAAGDVILKRHGRENGTGWSTETLLLLGLSEDANRPPDLAVKSFQTRTTVPYPPVKAFADVRKAYFTEMSDAIDSFLDNAPEATRSKETEVKADESKAMKAEEEPGPGDLDDADDLDALLQAADEGMELA